MHAFAAVLALPVLAVIPAYAVQCVNVSFPWYNWADNNNGQDPCQLVSEMYSSCASNVNPLQPLSYDPSGTNYYPGPNSSVQNICTCSYVMYNLMSACGDCQVGSSAPSAWPPYRLWAQSCDAVNTGGIYPNALPANYLDSIPVWARLSTKESGDPRWSYGLSHAIASGHVTVNPNLVASASTPCKPSSSPGLPIGTAFAGLFAGLLISLLLFVFQRKRSAHVIPTPTRYHTAPDNTPLVPLIARPAHAQGTGFLRRILEQNENDPRRIEPFDISAAASARSFPPHPAAFPQQRTHPFPPAVSVSGPSQSPSRQSSLASLRPLPAAHPSLHHSRSQSHTKSSSRPQTATSQFSSSGSGAGPSVMLLQELSPSSEPPSPFPLPSEHTWADILEDPPAYRRKS